MPKQSIDEALREVYETRSVSKARAVSDVLRFHFGVNYAYVVNRFAKANDIDEKTAFEIWDELMVEVEEEESW